MRTVCSTSSLSTGCIDLIRYIYKTTAMISPIIVPPDSCIFVSKYKIPKVEELAGVTLGVPREADDIQVPVPPTRCVQYLILSASIFALTSGEVGAADR